jgi:site-specific DNA-methyltransferase (adenine-specific)
MAGWIHFADNMDVLPAMDDGCIDLIYVDPPFNTGMVRESRQLRTVRDPSGDRLGFQGERYSSSVVGRRSFPDAFDDYLGFLEPRLREAHRLLDTAGSLYLHVDYREVHYCKILLDMIFGRECFLNEIIWAYDYGGRTKRRWPAKHDNILLYVKDHTHYTFNAEDVERIPYMAPGLVGAEKARRGKLPTDTWWHTVVPTSGTERTGYPTQKPLGVLKRVVAASSSEGDTVLDFFAGSGTTGEACMMLKRDFILVDNNPQAMEVMARRFGAARDVTWVGYDPDGRRRDVEEEA